MSASEEPQEKNSSDKANDTVPAKVHSANSWESADLGDDERKKKFLKLMGASKSEHHGRFIIGEKNLTGKTHGRDRKDTEEINKELEDQYKHTMEHKITKWSHKGLGYEKDDSAETDNTLGDSKKPDNSDESAKEGKTSNNDKTSSIEETTSKKRDSHEPAQSSESPPKKPKMMMNFVKASD